MLVIIDPGLKKMEGVSVLECSETPGLGAIHAYERTALDSNGPLLRFARIGRSLVLVEALRRSPLARAKRPPSNRRHVRLRRRAGRTVALFVTA